MSSAEHYKRKKRREKFKKIGLNILIWLVIISFVGSIGAGSFMNAVNFPKVMKINGKVYRYKTGSTFNYILNQNQDIYGKRFKGQASPQEIRDYSISRSVQDLLSSALLYDFGMKKAGIRPSKKAAQSIMRYMAGGRLPANPQDGFIEFVQMEYMRNALSGQNGDIFNAIAPVTTAELFSYFDLINYTAQAEVVWFDMTNYLEKRLNDKELSDYYQANLKKYTTKIVVEELTVQSKQRSIKMLALAREKGWNEAVKTFSTNKGVSYISSVILSNTGDTRKRFELVNGLKINELPEKSPFENSTYHIIKVKSYPTFDALDNDVAQKIRFDYLATNYQRIEQDAQKDLDALSARLAKLASKKPLKSVAKTLGLSYAVTAKLSPVDQRIRDNTGTTLDLPLLAETDYREYLFRGTPGVTSKVFRSPARILLMKLKKRGFNENQDYAEGIDRQVYLRYNTFKTRAVSEDWIRNLKENAKYEVFQKDIQKIYKLY